jgi:hypothetical protein
MGENTEEGSVKVMAKNKKAKKNDPPSSLDRNRFNMKVVTSDVCKVCKTQCPRGLRYLEQMSVPGGIGKGVPCILTRGKGYK